MNRNQVFIGHVDADCFYVSAERVRYWHLIGLPVGVLGNQGACVIAKSYEMKKYGVKTGMPIWEALKLCPDGIFIKRQFRWYEVLSRAMLAIIKEFSPKVEYYSIDECLFEAVPPKGLDYLQYATAIRDRIMEDLKIPVTVGIARTRTLAKLISDTAKPFGAVAVLDRETEIEHLERFAVSEVTGIAGRREKTLNRWGITSCMDFANADRRLIRELLTSTGEALWWELNGDSVLPLHPQRPLHKVLSRGGSFGESSSDPEIVWAWLVRNLERLIEELEYHEVKAERLTLWLGYRDGRAGEGHTRLESPSDRFDVLLDSLRPCLRRAWIPHATATRMHLLADRLVPRSCAQPGLFDDLGDRAEVLAEVKREINRRHGRFILRSAATLPLVGVYKDVSNEYDICDVRGKICF